jgi:hypothetical protein
MWNPEDEFAWQGQKIAPGTEIPRLLQMTIWKKSSQIPENMA